MGLANVCVQGKYEGLYYVDNDYLDVFHNNKTGESKIMGELDFKGDDIPEDWAYEPVESQNYWDDVILVNVQNEFSRRFPSFKPCSIMCGGVTRQKPAILENSLFYIAVEDNNWSVAFELIQKEDDYVCLEGLQKKHYEHYLKGLRDVLFTQFPELGIYAGPWTSGVIKK